MSAESLPSDLTPVTGPIPGASAFGFGPDGWPLTERVFTPPTSLGKAIDDFADILLAFERLRTMTVQNYVTYTHRILTHLPADAIAGDISPAQLRGWLDHEDARGLSASSQQLQWYALHAYYRWLSTLGFIGRSPLDHVRPPRALPVARRDYTADEAEAINEAARATAARYPCSVVPGSDCNQGRTTQNGPGPEGPGPFC